MLKLSHFINQTNAEYPFPGFLGNQTQRITKTEGEEIKKKTTAASLADYKSDAIFEYFFDDFSLERHYGKRREVGLGKRRRTRGATRRCWRR